MATREEIAQLLDTPPRQVDEWAKSGVIPSPVNKQYNPALCVRAVVNHFRAKAEPEAATVNRRELALWLDLSERRIFQLASDGVIPRQTSGGYALRDCVRLYCGFTRKGQDGKGGTITGDEKARLTLAQAEKTEYELSLLRREYVNRDEIEKAFIDVIDAAKVKALSLPDILAPLVLGVDNVNAAKKIIEDSIYQLLIDLSQPGHCPTTDEQREGKPGTGPLLEKKHAPQRSGAGFI